MRTDGLILDVDGTLWDSTGIVAKAWTRAVREGGFPEMTVTAGELKGLFGKPMDEIAACLLPGQAALKRAQILELCCRYEHQALEEDPCEICFPGVISAIMQLSGRLPVFIVSNCQSGYIELFLRKTALENYVRDWECFGDTGKGKAENIRLLSGRNALAHPVYVGDTQGDLEASREAGVPFIWASYGFGSPAAFDGRIRSFGELMELLECPGEP